MTMHHQGPCEIGNVEPDGRWRIVVQGERVAPFAGAEENAPCSGVAVQRLKVVDVLQMYI